MTTALQPSQSAAVAFGTARHCGRTAAVFAAPDPAGGAADAGKEQLHQ
jgi:hypothetical protein